MAECLGVEPYQAIGVPQKQTVSHLTTFPSSSLTRKQSAWTCDGSPDPGAACSGSQCETGTPTLAGTSTTTSTTTTTSSSTTPTPPPTRSNQVIHPNGN